MCETLLLPPLLLVSLFLPSAIMYARIYGGNTDTRLDQVPFFYLWQVHLPMILFVADGWKVFAPFCNYGCCSIKIKNKNVGHIEEIKQAVLLTSEQAFRKCWLKHNGIEKRKKKKKKEVEYLWCVCNGTYVFLKKKTFLWSIKSKRKLKEKSLHEMVSDFIFGLRVPWAEEEFAVCNHKLLCALRNAIESQYVRIRISRVQKSLFAFMFFILRRYSWTPSGNVSAAAYN